jgi:hypothetical protein
MRLTFLLGLVVVAPLAAQEPLVEGPGEPAEPRVQVGVFGFGMRAGADLEGDGQAVISMTLDAGHVLHPRLRIRPSGEMSFLGGPNRYLANLELLYRFTPDDDAAVPYVGGGIGLAGRDACVGDPTCPALWVQFVLGFDIRIREGISWQMEYHAEDSFTRHRLLVGLSTRGGWGGRCRKHVRSRSNGPGKRCGSPGAERCRSLRR